MEIVIVAIIVIIVEIIITIQTSLLLLNQLQTTIILIKLLQHNHQAIKHKLLIVMKRRVDLLHLKRIYYCQEKRQHNKNQMILVIKVLIKNLILLLPLRKLSELVLLPINNKNSHLNNNNNNNDNNNNNNSNLNLIVQKQKRNLLLLTSLVQIKV